MIPKVLKYFNLIVDGQGFCDRVDEIQLPDLGIVTEDHRAGGMDAPIPLDMGMEAIDLSFTVADHDPKIYSQFGLISQDAVSVTFRAAAVGDNNDVDNYVVEARGMYRTISGASVSPGAKAPLEATIGCRYYKLSIGGQTLIEIDIPNMVRKIGGRDQMEAIRSAIGR